MDYGTYFITNIASVTVVTVCIVILALRNRHIVGMRWFAGAQLVGLVKLILQGLEGRVTPWLGGLTVSELYLVGIMMQWMGLRWFVVRRPMQSKWPWAAVGFVLVAYIGTFVFQVPYSANVLNLPFVVVCGASAWMLWKNAAGPFRPVASAAAVVAALQMGVAGFRAVLTNVRYTQPHQTVNAHADPYWVYSLAAAAFLASFMAMCELWFLVTELQRELAEQARTDPLTGAFNRRAMEEAALRETARSMRSDYALSMIILDIDNFKLLNDTRGHAAGDCALKALVRRFRAVLRKGDLVARTGGEEFAILLPQTVDLEALAIAERVREAVEELIVPFESEPLRMTICAGVAQLDPDAGWEKMMQAADAAMYEAKKRGRNLISARFTENGINVELRSQYNLQTRHYVQAAILAM